MNVLLILTTFTKSSMALYGWPAKLPQECAGLHVGRRLIASACRRGQHPEHHAAGAIFWFKVQLQIIWTLFIESMRQNHLSFQLCRRGHARHLRQISRSSICMATASWSNLHAKTDLTSSTYLCNNGCGMHVYGEVPHQFRERLH